MEYIIELVERGKKEEIEYMTYVKHGNEYLPSMNWRCTYKEVHDKAERGNAFFNRLYYNVNTDSGVIAAAVQIARKTIANTEYSNATFISMSRTLDKIAARMNSAIKGGNDSGAALYEIIADADADSADLIAAAYDGILAQLASGAAVYGKDGEKLTATAAAYKCGYSAANTYLMAERRKDARTVSTEYVQESGGDIVSISKYVGRILKDTDSYSAATSDFIDGDINERLAAFIRDVYAIVTPRQQLIIRLLAKNYDVPSIALKLNCSRPTVYSHLSAIRSKAYAVIGSDKYADIAYYVNIDLLVAEREKQAAKTREQSNKRGAEYYRAYRAKKRLARELASNHGTTDIAAEQYKYNGVGALCDRDSITATPRTMDSATAAAYAAAAYKLNTFDASAEFETPTAAKLTDLGGVTVRDLHNMKRDSNGGAAVDMTESELIAAWINSADYDANNQKYAARIATIK